VVVINPVPLHLEDEFQLDRGAEREAGDAVSHRNTADLGREALRLLPGQGSRHLARRTPEKCAEAGRILVRLCWLKLGNNSESSKA
jgi:hypothetical protein